MNLSDPLSDMLVRIRNAQNAGLEIVEMPHSRIKGEISKVLKKEGYVSDYVVEGGVKKNIRIYLKYTVRQEPVIRGLSRISKPGHRRYVGRADIPRILGGMGISVLSTSQGIMTGSDAKKRGLGGELICAVW